MRAWWIVIAMMAGCLRQTEFRCETSSQCGTNGTCQMSIGYCSFPDAVCGQRFGPQAGMYANKCVGETPIVDAGVDTPSMPGDGPGSDATNHCPSGYNTITNGTPGHRYRLLTADNWTNQRDFCAATSQFAYLAIPDDAAEVGALDMLAGAAPDYWIGIDDLATSGTYLTVKGTAPPYLLWEPGQPNNGPPPADCVETVTADGKFSDEKCGTSLPAVCECE